MKYARLPLKVIQFDDLKILKPGIIYDRVLKSVFKEYPRHKKEELPIQVDWKFRIYENQKNVYSFVTETQAIIINDGIEPTRQEAEMLIENLILLAEVYWEDHTRMTPFQGSTLPSFRGVPTNELTDLILESYRKIPK